MFFFVCLLLFCVFCSCCRQFFFVFSWFCLLVCLSSLSVFIIFDHHHDHHHHRYHHYHHHDDHDHYRCSWQTCAKKSEGLLSMLNSLSDPLTLLGKTPSMCYRSGLWHRVGSHRTFSLVSSCRLLYYASYYLGCLRLSSQAHLISQVSCRSSPWAVVLLSLCRLAIRLWHWALYVLSFWRLPSCMFLSYFLACEILVIAVVAQSCLSSALLIDLHVPNTL